MPATPFITKDELKVQLNIESTFTDDDAYLTSLCAVAEETIRNYCNGGLDEITEVPVVVKQAALLLGSHLYLTRSIVSYAQGYEIPYSFKFLLNFYKVESIA